MTKEEARQANTLHAIWDILIMKHSINSALDDWSLNVADIENVRFKLKEKLDDYQRARELSALWSKAEKS